MTGDTPQPTADVKARPPLNRDPGDHLERKGPRTTADWWMVGLTAIIAVATVVNVWTFYKESEETSKQVQNLADKSAGVVTAMNQALADSQENIKKALDAGSQQAKDTLAQSTNALHISERPYVTLENVRFDPPLEQNHQPALVKYDFHNAGKTPALHGTFAVDVYLDGQKTKSLPRQFLASITIPAGMGVTNSNSIWLESPGDFDGVTSGVRQLAIKGRITYSDIFKDKHSTDFCTVYDAKVTKGWVYCPGNDVK
jgi:hypothetical protein